MVQLDKWRQLVVMIQGCSPGGNISNIVVYWMGGITDLRFEKNFILFIYLLFFLIIKHFEHRRLLDGEGLMISGLDRILLKYCFFFS